MSLAQRPSPNASAINVSKLVRAALLIGRGFPPEHVAAQLEVNPHRLRVELQRHGVDREPAAYVDRDPNLSLQLRLTQAERVTLGTAALDREMYRDAVAARLLRTALGHGKWFVDAILDDGERR